MKFLRATAASLLATACSSSVLPDLEARQAPGPGSYYAVTGAKGGTHPRLEIRELAKTGNMWNLVLLALTEFEAMDQNKIDSFYQIAGIHGMPWTDWDGVTFNPGHGGPPTRGYCPHAMLLFATWHRPYLMLFEQKLQAIAIDIAGRFTGAAKASYQDAANKLRLPYWDWAQAVPQSEAAFPTVLAAEKVQVTFPNNTVAQINNPWFDYDFHPKDNSINKTGCAGFGGPLDRHDLICDLSQRTLRNAPKPNVNVSNHVEQERISRLKLESRRRNFYGAFTRWQTFDGFSNIGHCGAAQQENVWSFETSHDNVHLDFAPGHMVPPAVSAFDPVFWLHHANVDRQLALWQAVFPYTYVQSCTADSATWTILRDQVIDANTPLTPFHKNAAGDFWTSANCRYLKDLGYTYPELANNPSNATLVAQINRLYSGPADVVPTKAKRQEGNSTTERDYFVEVDTPMLGAPYSVSVFLGDVSDNAAEWAGAESFVGSAGSLGTGNSGMVVKSTVDLTAAVEQKIEAGDITAENAIDYLKENLKWRVGLGDVEISREKVPGVKISLVSTEVVKATSETEFDRYVGDFEQHGEIDA